MNSPQQLQLDAGGRLQHLLTTEGLPRALVTEILDRAESFILYSLSPFSAY